MFINEIYIDIEHVYIIILSFLYVPRFSMLITEY